MVEGMDVRELGGQAMAIKQRGCQRLGLSSLQRVGITWPCEKVAALDEASSVDGFPGS